MILLINNETSSINVAVYSDDSLERIIDIGINQFSDKATSLQFGVDSISLVAPDHVSALRQILDLLFARSLDPSEIWLVGHLVPRIDQCGKHTALLSGELETLIESAATTGSSKLGTCLKTIQLTKRWLPACTHIAFFVSPEEGRLDYEEMLEVIYQMINSNDKN